MKTMPLGHTGVEVSCLCLGCMYFGTRIDEAQSFALLDQYVEAGGSFLDTANNYAYWVEGFKGGESETVLGRWMKERGNRDQILLATKMGLNTPPHNPPGMSATKIAEECEKSLRRLQTDYIDLYYAHTDRRETPLEESLEAFDKLVRQGKVGYIGCSNTLAWRIEKARTISRQHGWAEYCCVQQRHTYLRPKPGLTAFFGVQVPVNTDLIDYAVENGDFTIVAYSILLGGAYARSDHRIPDNYQPDDYDRADAEARLKVLHAVANEVGATLNQVVLAWMLQGRPPMIPLIASGSEERLRENLDAEGVTLTEGQIERLSNASA